MQIENVYITHTVGRLLNKHAARFSASTTDFIFAVC